MKRGFFIKKIFKHSADVINTDKDCLLDTRNGGWYSIFVDVIDES